MLELLLLAPRIDPDAKVWASAVVANGGSVSENRFALVSRTIAYLKASGDWANADDLMVYAAENPAAGLVSWKQRLVGVPFGSALTWQTDSCVVFNGTDNGIDTGFNPSTKATVMTGSDQMIGVNEVTNLSTNTIAAGAFTATANRLNVNPRFSTNASGSANYTGTNFTTTPASDGRGLTSFYRTASTFGAAKNGVSLGTTTPSGNSTTLLNLNIFAGCLNNAGTAGTFRASNMAYLVLGGSALALSPSFYTIMQAHLGAI